jgi:hypothetical protein
LLGVDVNLIDVIVMVIMLLRVSMREGRLQFAIGELTDGA